MRIWAVQLAGSPLGRFQLARPAPTSVRDDLQAALEASSQRSSPSPEDRCPSRYERAHDGIDELADDVTEAVEESTSCVSPPALASVTASATCASAPRVRTDFVTQTLTV